MAETEDLALYCQTLSATSTWVSRDNGEDAFSFAHRSLIEGDVGEPESKQNGQVERKSEDKNGAKEEKRRENEREKGRENESREERMENKDRRHNGTEEKNEKIEISEEKSKLGDYGEIRLYPTREKLTNRRKVKTPARRILLAGKACFLKRDSQALELVENYPVHSPPLQAAHIPHSPHLQKHQENEHKIPHLEKPNKHVGFSHQETSESQNLQTSYFSGVPQLPSSLHIEKLQKNKNKQLPYQKTKEERTLPALQTSIFSGSSLLSQKSHLDKLQKNINKQLPYQKTKEERTSPALQTSIFSGVSQLSQKSHLEKLQKNKNKRATQLETDDHFLQTSIQFPGGPEVTLTPHLLKNLPSDLPQLLQLRSPQLSPVAQSPKKHRPYVSPPSIKKKAPVKLELPQTLELPESRVSITPRVSNLPPPPRLKFPPMPPQLLLQRLLPESPSPVPLDLTVGSKSAQPQRSAQSFVSLKPPDITTNILVTSPQNAQSSHSHIQKLPGDFTQHSSSTHKNDPQLSVSHSTLSQQHPCDFTQHSSISRNCNSLSPPSLSYSPSLSPPTRRKCHSLSPPRPSDSQPTSSHTPLSPFISEHNPINHSTSENTPLNHSTSEHTPINHSTSLNPSTSAHTPINHSSSSHTPLNPSTSAHTPINHSTSLNHSTSSHTPLNPSTSAHTPLNLNHSTSAHTPINHSTSAQTPINPSNSSHTDRCFSSTPHEVHHPEKLSISSSPPCQNTSEHAALATTNKYSPTREEMEEEMKRKKKICDVCGDIARSLHFGGRVCDSCKAFFRRAVISQAAHTFLCTHKGGCTITLATRRSCQACRFIACVRAGMDVSLVAREDETARHNNYHHSTRHSNHLTPSAFHNTLDPNTPSGAPWLPHQSIFATPTAFIPPPQDTSARSKKIGSPSTASATSPFAVFSPFAATWSATQAGKISASSSFSSSSSHIGQTLTFGLTQEDAVELKSLQETYLLAFKNVEVPLSDADIKCEELGRVYSCFVAQRTNFLVSTPYYQTLDPADRAHQLHIAVAMSTYFTGAHHIDTSDFTIRKYRATEKSPLPPVVLTAATVRQFLSQQQFTHLMRFYTQFSNALEDHTVSIIMQVLSLFHPEPGVTTPGTVEAGRQHYTALLARYLTSTLGSTCAAEQLAVLLTCQYEARQLVGLLDSLDLTPNKPDPVKSQPSSTLQSNLEKLCHLVREATRKRVPSDSLTKSTSLSMKESENIERKAAVSVPADLQTKSISLSIEKGNIAEKKVSLSVEEAGDVISRLAECDDSSTLEQARAILPTPLLNRLLTLLQSSNQKPQSPGKDHVKAKSSRTHGRLRHSPEKHIVSMDTVSISTRTYGRSSQSPEKFSAKPMESLSISKFPEKHNIVEPSNVSRSRRTLRYRQPLEKHNILHVEASSPRQPSPILTSPLQFSPPRISPFQPTSARTSPLQPVHFSPRQSSPVRTSPLQTFYSARQPSSVHSSPRQLSPPISTSPLQPSSARSSPLQPSSARTSPLQPSSARSSPLQPSSARSSPLQPSARSSPKQPPSPSILTRQPSPIQPSPVRFSPHQPSPAHSSPLQPSSRQPSPSPAHSSPLQPSPSPLQPSPSPLRPSPAHSSPLQPSSRQPSPSPRQPSPSPAHSSPLQPSPRQPSPSPPSPLPTPPSDPTQPTHPSLTLPSSRLFHLSSTPSHLPPVTSHPS